MNETKFDEVTRALSTEQSRRGALRALAGLALGGAAALGLTDRTSAAEGDAPSFGFLDDGVSVEGNKKKRRAQRKKKKCKKKANACRADAAAYCAFWYIPQVVPECRASLGSCCSHVAKCQTGKANACIVNSPWYVPV